MTWACVGVISDGLTCLRCRNHAICREAVKRGCSVMCEEKPKNVVQPPIITNRFATKRALYINLLGQGPMTAAELAERSGTLSNTAASWCSSGAKKGLLTVAGYGARPATGGAPPRIYALAQPGDGVTAEAQKAVANAVAPPLDCTSEEVQCDLQES